MIVLFVDFLCVYVHVAYGKSMVAAAKQKGKGGLPQGYLKSLNSVQVWFV